MLSRIRKLQVRSALQCCVVIHNYRQCPRLADARRFLATSNVLRKPTSNKSSSNKLLESFSDKTIIVDYIGDRYGGNMHGLGMITYLNGDTYEGQLEHNQRHGFGKFVSNDGYIYQGEWINGSMHGAGTIYYDNGDIFSGQFQNNSKIHGRWTYYQDKSVYEGQIYDELPHGRGELTLSNGDKYEGRFCNGQKSSMGTYTGADGSSYVGGWRRDLKHGHGKEQAPNGDVYVGDYHHGQKNGEGAMTWADGSSYVGHWAADQPNGVGTLTDASGTAQKGVFVDGVYSAKQSQQSMRYMETKASRAHKENTPTAPSSPTMEEPATLPYITLAEFLRGREILSIPPISLVSSISTTPEAIEPNASTLDNSVTTEVVHYPAGDLRATYEGGLTATRMRHGQGKVTNRDGTTWVGVFKSGLPYTGQGTMVYKTGRVQVGRWKKGKFLNGLAEVKSSGSDTSNIVQPVKTVKKPLPVQTKLEKTPKTTKIPKNQTLLMYMGEGKDGALHGQGTTIYPDGRTQQGEFREGQPAQLLSKGI